MKHKQSDSQVSPWCFLPVLATMVALGSCADREGGKTPPRQRVVPTERASPDEADRTGGEQTASSRVPGQAATITWHHDLPSGLQAAKEQARLVFVDFFATWCPPCKMMNQQVFPQPSVAEALRQLVAVKIDVDKHKAEAVKYQIQGVPTLMVMDASGQIISKNVGALSAAGLGRFVARAVERASEKAGPAGTGE